MDGICRAVGAPLPVIWQGRMRLVSPLRLADIGAVEHFLLSQRTSPLRVALRRVAGAPLESQELLIRIAADEERKLPGYITPLQLQQFIETREGAALCWWLMMRQQHPRATFESIERAIARLDDDEFDDLQRHISLVSGISREAERDWPRGEDDDEDEDGDGTGSKRFNWKYAIRKVCEAYMGMTPNSIGELTLYTFRELYVDAKSLKGRRVPLSQWYAEQAKKEEESAKEG